MGHWPRGSSRVVWTGVACLAGLALALGACAGGTKPRARMVRPTIERNVPEALRGTIGAMASFRQVEPMLVSGYGLIVGLNGTGGGELPEDVATTMERQLGLMGVSVSSDYFVGTPLEGLSPRQVLRHPDVAVAVVYAAVPPGAPNGARFDVYVQAVNNAGLTSLEGGTLWTTDLRMGTPTTLGGIQAKRLAVARGPVFINPFAEPIVGDAIDDGMTRNVGRILNGGLVTDSTDIQIVLDSPSHSGAKAVVGAINNRFTRGVGDREQTARGTGDAIVLVSVPAEYRDRSGEFLSILRGIRTDPSVPEAYAQRYVEALRSDPGLGEELSWCLQALGTPAIPAVRELYDAGEVVPRLAALRAGAALGDPRAAPYLRELAETGPLNVRTQAITLLGALDAGPTVDVALRDLLDEPELGVRVAAYEALADRASRIESLRRQREYLSRPITERRFDPSILDEHRAWLDLAGDRIQGIERRNVGDKFLLDVVPVGEPLIYVTQQGIPRVVLFGADLGLVRPLLITAWSDRLMLTSEGETDEVRLFYRDPRTGEGSIYRPGRDLPEIVEFLAHQPTPEDPSPGLGMTYSQVVGAVYAIQRAGGVNAAFATENDRLQAQLARAAEGVAAPERPETAADAERLTVHAPVAPKAPEVAGPGAGEKPSLVVPAPPRTEPKKP